MKVRKKRCARKTDLGILPKTTHGIKYVISADLALRNNGVAVHDNMGELLESFNIKTPNGLLDHDSVDRIVEEFFKRLDRYLANPDHVVVYIEDILFARQGKGTARAEVAGVVKWNLRQHGVMMYGVDPRGWSSWLAAKHNMKAAHPGGGRVNSKDIKRCTMEVLHRHYNFYTQDDNIADAVGIGKFGLAHSIEKKRLSVRALAKFT